MAADDSPGSGRWTEKRVDSASFSPALFVVVQPRRQMWYRPLGHCHRAADHVECGGDERANLFAALPRGPKPVNEA